MSTLNGHKVVADIPAFLYAMTQDVSGGFILWVYASPIVQESYEPLREVMALVQGRCTTTVARAFVPDEAMAWGESVRTTYAVHETCPGSAMRHHCALTEGITEKKVS
jgi:hypothetical protein